MNTLSVFLLWLTGIVVIIALVSTAGLIGIVVSVILLAVIIIYIRINQLYEIAKISKKTWLGLEDLKFILKKKGVIAEKDIKENMERVINTFIDINDEEDQKT